MIDKEVYYQLTYVYCSIKIGLNARHNFGIGNKVTIRINKDLFIELWKTINPNQIHQEI